MTAWILRDGLSRLAELDGSATDADAQNARTRQAILDVASANLVRHGERKACPEPSVIVCTGPETRVDVAPDLRGAQVFEPERARMQLLKRETLARVTAPKRARALMAALRQTATTRLEYRSRPPSSGPISAR